MSTDYLRAVGAFHGEPAIADLLDRLSISGAPKLKRGDSTAYMANRKLGIELTFTEEDDLDHPTRAYPEGALILNSIRFYGEGSDPDFTPYADALPFGLAFGMSYQQAVGVLGSDDDDDPDKSLVRWDFDGYCVFGDFEDDRLFIVSLQLPVVAGST